MTYNHLTSNELAMIEAYYNNHQSVAKTAWLLNRSRQTIHKVYQFFKTGHNALYYLNQYKKNKTRCGRRPIVLSDEQTEYIQKRLFKVGHLMWLLAVQSFLFLVLCVHFIVCLNKAYLKWLTYLWKENVKPTDTKKLGENNLFVDQFVTEKMIILNSIKNLATLKGILLWVKSTKVLSLPSLSDYLK